MLEKISDLQMDEKVLKKKGLIFVDLYADWCGPCKLMAATLNQLLLTHSEKVTLYKIDVDKNPLTAQKYNVKGLPSILIFKDGALIDCVVGNQPIEALSSIILKNS